MSGVAYIRFFGDDWLSGTQELCLEERGALVTIVALTASTGSAPALDYMRLSRRFGCTPGKAKKIIQALVDLGKISIEGDAINNKRALMETEISQKYSKKQSENASARWSKKPKKSNTINDDTNATALPRECQPEPEPYKKDSVSNDTGAGAPIDPAKQVFDSGVSILRAAGKSESQARAVVGKWRKNHTDEAVIAALGQCQRAGALEPVSFVEAVLKGTGRKPPAWKDRRMTDEEHERAWFT